MKRRRMRAQNTEHRFALLRTLKDDLVRADTLPLVLPAAGAQGLARGAAVRIRPVSCSCAGVACAACCPLAEDRNAMGAVRARNSRVCRFMWEALARRWKRALLRADSCFYPRPCAT